MLSGWFHSIMKKYLEATFSLNYSQNVHSIQRTTLKPLTLLFIVMIYCIIILFTLFDWILGYYYAALLAVSLPQVA